MSSFVLHVGPPKTGTTSVQHALLANSAALEQHGYRVIPDQWLLRNAASEVAGVPHEQPGTQDTDALAQLQREIHDDPDAVVVASCERFSALEPAQVRDLVDHLRVDVRAVLTLRAPQHLLPSRWQERVKNGGTESWTDFCARVVQEPAFLHRMLRMRSTLRTWSQTLGPDRVTVVTVPADRPADELVDRFGLATGIPAEALAHGADERRNPAISTPGVEVLRRLNVLGTLGGTSRAERKAVVAGLFTEDGDAGPPVPPEVDRVAGEYAAALVAEIRATGCTVVGSTEDLDLGVETRPAEDPATDDVLDAALQALSVLAERLHEQEPPNPVQQPRRRFLRSPRRGRRRS